MSTPAPAEAGGPAKRWEQPIPLLTSRFFLRDSALAIGISVAVMYAAVFLMGLAVDGEPVVLPWQFAAFAFGFFGLLFPFVALMVFQNRFDASFAVTAAGFEVGAGSKARRVNRIVLFIALLSGRAAAVGPALLASSDESRVVAWSDVRAVRYYPRQGVIELRDSIFRTNRLFCPPAEYESIAARVRAELDRAPRQTRAIDWRDAGRRLAWCAGAAAGWFFAVAWYPDATLVWLSWGTVAIVLSEWLEWWLGRAVAILGVACLAFATALIAARALDSREFDGLFTIYGYESDTGLLWITSGGLAILLLLGLRSVLRARTG